MQKLGDVQKKNTNITMIKQISCIQYTIEPDRPFILQARVTRLVLESQLSMIIVLIKIIVKCSTC